jgi:thiol-disulfide isomerase/thioredoxin
MKKIISFFTFSFLFLTHLTAQTTVTEGGIQFLHDDWKTAIRLSKSMNKPIFLDAHTNWCAPCKLMSRTTFVDKNVVQFFNEKFINLKMDMEQGDGIILAKKYGIKAYPTLLFIDNEGIMLHRGVGMKEVEPFLELAKEALDPEKRLAAWDNRYTKGERNPDFLKDYALRLSQVLDPRQQIAAEAYLQTQKSWLTNDNLKFIYRFADDARSPLFAYLVKNKARFKTLFGEDVEVKIQNATADCLLNEKNLPSLTLADSIIELVYEEAKAERYASNYRLVYYRMKGDRQAYAEAAEMYFKDYDDDADELAETATTFSEVIDDKKKLKKAEKWAKRATKLAPTTANYIALAKVQQKRERNKSAKKTLEKAIKEGKNQNNDVSEAEELLKTL